MDHALLDKRLQQSPALVGLFIWFRAVKYMLSVHGIFQRFARFKFGLLTRRDLDGFARARILTGCRSALHNRESAETYEPNVITALQRAGNVVKYAIDGLIPDSPDG